MPTVLVTSGYVVYSGKTLTVGGTATLGSGRTVTHIALQTDSAGATVIVGNTVTSAPQTSPGVEIPEASLPVSSTPQFDSALTSFAPSQSPSLASNKASRRAEPSSRTNAIFPAVLLFWLLVAFA